MDTNKNDGPELIYPELSYDVTGVCFVAHNALGQYAREKQYGDIIETKLKEKRLPYKRELALASSGNIVDFLIDDKIVLELKSVRILTKDIYEQVQRYLQESGMRLGLLVNFRNKYIKPVRVVRIDSRRYL
ncbi:MAG: GxxExxY protein [Patescibacteria group bacterium]